ncbi:MAG: hypothetical protein AB1758_29335 [Candidatus Eremiobacterota bacterium]
MTVAEVVIAISLVGVLVVSVLSVFTYLLAASSKSTHQTVGLLFAQRRLDLAAQLGPPTWGADAPLTWNAGTGIYREDPTDTTTLGGMPGGGVYTHDEQHKTMFWHQFEARLIRSNQMGDLYQFWVQVIWWADESGAQPQVQWRQGTGRQSIELTRTYYYSNVKPRP